MCGVTKGWQETTAITREPHEGSRVSLPAGMLCAMAGRREHCVAASALAAIM
jgi:hypothetical protein